MKHKPQALITKQDALDQVCRRWRDAGRFAFDTEFIRDDTFDAVLCLVQVAAEDEVVLIDPTADLDLSPFWSLVTDPDVLTIVHAGKEDFEVCLTATGRPPQNIFDVQTAAGFVGYGYPLSLSRLVALVTHKRLSKGQTLTDWLRRPLTDEQLRYAVDDVAYLPAIHENIDRKLRELERVEWAAEEFRIFEDAQTYRPAAEDRVFKLKGSKKLDALGLVTLAKLVEWRDAWARERNRPTRALMRDDVLVEIAKRRPTKATQLQVLRGFHQARNAKVVQDLLDVIAEAGKVPQAERPEPFQPREETPMDRVVLDIASACLRAICHEENVDQNLVGGAQRLRDLLDHHSGVNTEHPALLQGWRERFVGRRLIDLLDGRSELHLSGWPNDPRLDVVSHSPE